MKRERQHVYLVIKSVAYGEARRLMAAIGRMVDTSLKPRKRAGYRFGIVDTAKADVRIVRKARRRRMPGNNCGMCSNPGCKGGCYDY